MWVALQQMTHWKICGDVLETLNGKHVAKQCIGCNSTRHTNKKKCVHITKTTRLVPKCDTGCVEWQAGQSAPHFLLVAHLFFRLLWWLRIVLHSEKNKKEPCLEDMLRTDRSFRHIITCRDKDSFREGFWEHGAAGNTTHQFILLFSSCCSAHEVGWFSWLGKYCNQSPTASSVPPLG